MLGPLLCGTAAYRLSGTPLFAFAVVLALVNLAGLCWVVLAARRDDAEVPRVATALQHVSMALGGFLLFVSFAVG